MKRTAYAKLPPLGKRIAMFLFDNGITQTELAHKVGISSQHISKIIKGECDPQLKTLRKISEASGIPFKDLIATYDE